MKTSLPDDDKTKTQHSGDEEGVSGTFPAPFPHLSRCYKAGKVLDRCGKDARYGESFYQLSVNGSEVIRESSKHNQTMIKSLLNEINAKKIICS